VKRADELGWILDPARSADDGFSGDLSLGLCEKFGPPFLQNLDRQLKPFLAETYESGRNICESTVS
jgi:hypothetical protein